MKRWRFVGFGKDTQKGWAIGGLVAVVVLTMAGAGGPAALAGPIAPNQITGLQAWYRVDSGLTLAGTTGTEVSAWNDSSGLGRNMSQATSANRPTLIRDSSFGFPVVSFDGSNDFLSAGDVEVHSNTDGLTVIGVVRPRTVNTSGLTTGNILSKFQYATGGRAWRLGIDWWAAQNNADAYQSTHELTFPPSADPIANQWNIVVGSWTPGVSTAGYMIPMSGPNAFQEISAGAASQAAASVPDTTAALLMGACNAGGDHRLNGELVEVVVYNRALTQAERRGLTEYFQQKYTLQTDPTRPLLVNINFEGVGAAASNQPLPPGYSIDAGAPGTYHGNGVWSYWDRDVSSWGRNRNAASSPDERFDTLIHMYNSGQSPYQAFTWQLAVPNGTYWVRAVFGEPSTGTSTNNIYIQNQLFTDPDPGLTGDWDEYFGIFTVSNGRVTITPQPEAAAKICFMQAASVFHPQIAINFEGTGSNASNNPLPPHYLIDNGAAFGDRGNGYKYGWVDPATGNPIDNQANGRNRNSAASPDERYDTLNHFYRSGTQHYNWEIELPNGNYFVLAMFGEPGPEAVGGTSTNNVWIENVRFYDPDPAKSSEWDLFMGVVAVSDGRLTLRDIGLDQPAKIAFIEITLVPEPSTWLLLAFGMCLSVGLWHWRRRNTER
ncbi:MAG: PEP-CTERM sorting domain-containing protein [Thermoguttaceae bacterium]|nr:PEP-CTERM sorting domain-containing protein [Thermoguttaceae bacterium]MDW8036837.1 PEP-CTERM sorting domain-containing protein [Thermoguttaceae bacterium]